MMVRKKLPQLWWGENSRGNQGRMEEPTPFLYFMKPHCSTACQIKKVSFPGRKMYEKVALAIFFNLQPQTILAGIKTSLRQTW